MTREEAIEILTNALEGNPNSCLSEHSRGLEALRQFILDGAAPPPPQAAPAPQPRFSVLLTLEKTYECADEGTAFELALEDIATRRGMELIGHQVVSVPKH